MMVKFKAQNLRNLRSAALLAWKSAPLLTITNLSLSIFQGLLPLLLLVLTKQLIDAVVLSLSSPILPRSAERAIFFICCMVVISLLQEVLRSLSAVANEAR
jgi:ATP-binding cassette subfamily B protein